MRRVRFGCRVHPSMSCPSAHCIEGERVGGGGNAAAAWSEFTICLCLALQTRFPWLF